MKHKIHNIVILGALLLASCTDLSVSRFSEEDPDMDEYTADAVFSLRAEQSPDNVVSMTFTYGGSENSAAKGIFLKADKPAESNLTVALASAGEDFVADYSESTGIGYTLLPAAFWRFSGGDMISLAAGASESPVNTLTIFAVNTLGNVLEPGRYLLPLVASSLTEELSDSTIFVDVNVVEPYTDPDGYELYTGEDMFTVFYINTSSFDPRLANDMAIGFFQDGTYEYYGIGNIVNLRTSSLEYDETTGKVSILPSADTRYVLEHYAERVLPVQESGRKVCICIEGGGQGIGFCNLDDSQIADFVSSVKRLVETYPIDGINLWDRNSGYDKAGENGFPAMNTTSYPKLIKAIREAIGPDKLLTVVDYEEPTEYFHDTQATGGIEVGQYIDYAWSGYCSENEPVQIVDPWHQGMSQVSDLHPRQPIAGLDRTRYGCVHATIYTGSADCREETVTEWVKQGYNPNGISVYYDIRSVIQDKYESGGRWAPDYIIKRWFDDNMITINNPRLYNTIGEHNPSGTKYNKWIKDW